jgi:hypothetical protein
VEGLASSAQAWLELPPKPADVMASDRKLSKLSPNSLSSRAENKTNNEVQSGRSLSD